MERRNAEHAARSVLPFFVFLTSVLTAEVHCTPVFRRFALA
jgi:hypothetical protein